MGPHYSYPSLMGGIISYEALPLYAPCVAPSSALPFVPVYPSPPLCNLVPPALIRMRQQTHSAAGTPSLCNAAQRHKLRRKLKRREQQTRHGGSSRQTGSSFARSTSNTHPSPLHTQGFRAGNARKRAVCYSFVLTSLSDHVLTTTTTTRLIPLSHTT